MLLLGLIFASVLLAVGVIKTVRHHGWGQQTWAPPAIPWLTAGGIVLALTVVGAILWVAVD